MHSINSHVLKTYCSMSIKTVCMKMFLKCARGVQASLSVYYCCTRCCITDFFQAALFKGNTLSRIDFFCLNWIG